MLQHTVVPDSRVAVQYCPCGHVELMSEEAMQRIALHDQLMAIDAGLKIDAVTLPSSECPDCRAWRERQDRLNAEMLEGWD